MFAVTNADLKECFHYFFALIVVALIVLAVTLSYDIFLLEFCFVFFCTTWNFVVDGHLCWQKNRVN